MAGRRPFSEWEVRLARPILRAVSRINVWVYRASGGCLGSRSVRGAPICLLTTVGRKTERRRTTPILYLADEERLVVVASQAGMPRHPSWYLNLQANPVAEVQIGSAVRKVTARTATDEEKARYWPRLTAMYRDFDDYQARTERDIPVVILSPR